MPKRKAPPTAWKPGQSGNPLGAARKKSLTDALRLAANEEIDDPNADKDKPRKAKRLRLVAEALLTQAIEGDVPAIREVYDRLEGKVANINVNAETPLDGADTGALRALQEALEGLAAERDPKPASGDEGETVH